MVDFSLGLSGVIRVSKKFESFAAFFYIKQLYPILPPPQTINSTTNKF